MSSGSNSISVAITPDFVWNVTKTADHIYDKAASGGTTAPPTDMSNFSTDMRELFEENEASDAAGWHIDTVFTGMPPSHFQEQIGQTPVDRDGKIGEADTTEQHVEEFIQGIETVFDGEETPDPAKAVVEHLQNELP